MLDSLVGILPLETSFNFLNLSAFVVDACDSQETPSTSQTHSRLSQMNSSGALNLTSAEFRIYSTMFDWINLLR